MTRAGRCSSFSASRSRRTDGKEGADPQGGREAQVRGSRVHPLPALRAAEGGLPQVRPVPRVHPRDGAPRRASRREQGFLVTEETASPQAPGRGTAAREADTALTMTDPIADMLTRLRNANQAYHERVSMPYSKIKANIAEV